MLFFVHPFLKNPSIFTSMLLEWANIGHWIILILLNIYFVLTQFFLLITRYKPPAILLATIAVTLSFRLPKSMYSKRPAKGK